MDNPMLTVITVCKNVADELEITVRSVLNQTFTDFEYVIKDGGSTDETEKVIKNYRKQFEARGIELKYISARDLSLYDAMNQAISYCNGKWVHYLNAGDYYYNATVLKAVFSYDGDNRDVLYGDILEHEEKHYYHLKARIDNLTEKCNICQPAAFIRTAWLRDCNFSLTYKIGADYDFFLKTFFEGRKFFYIPEVITVFEKNGISSTNELGRVLETEAIRESYGLTSKNSAEYKKKIRVAKVKQWILDYTPKWFSDWLRVLRRKRLK